MRAEDALRLFFDLFSQVVLNPHLLDRFQLHFDPIDVLVHIFGHILYLDGVPNVQRMNTVQVGETVLEQLKLDLKAEQEMLTLLSDGVVHSTKVTDFTTRHMLEDMAKDVDQHIDWIEMQLESIKQVGIENYLAEQIKKES